MPANHPGNPAYNTFLYPIIQSVQIACDGSNINPVSLALMNVKLPNGSYYIPGNPSGVYGPVTFTDPATFTEHQLIANGDYIINSKNTLSVKYFWTADPQYLPISAAPTCPERPSHQQVRQYQLGPKLTTLLTSSMVNELHVAGQRNGQHWYRYHRTHAAVHRSGDHRADHNRTAGDRDF